MTGYTVHTGSTVKFSQGWDLIFQGSKAKKSALAEPAKSSKTAKPSKKVAAKKSAPKTVKSAVGPVGKKKSATKSAKRGK